MASELEPETGKKKKFYTISGLIRENLPDHNKIYIGENFNIWKNVIVFLYF